MASKIFMGDMPELLEIILNNLDEEIRSLYSCALVSRFWSKISIPILWRDPFSICLPTSFISRYFSSLNEHDIFILNECGIVVEFPNTLFPYAKFLKVLNLSDLDLAVADWIGDLSINLRNDIKIVKYNLANLLFKLFIERGASLTKFYLHISDNYNDDTFEIKPEIFYSLGRNEGFFFQLQNLTVDVQINPCPQNAITLLKILDDNAKKINTLKFLEVYDDEPQLLHSLTCVIKSQEKIRRINLQYNSGHIISALKCHQSSLSEIIMDSCDFSYAGFNELMNFKNLKVIRIYHGNDTNRLLNILDNGLCRINTLEIRVYSINVSNMLQMLRRSGSLLQRLGLSSEQKEILSSPLLLGVLTSFCPNITYLDLSIIKLSDQFLTFISCLQKLQFMTLHWIGDESEEEMKISVIAFARILPISLHYLNLHNRWDNSNLYIDVLLNHCNAPLKKLLLKIDYGDQTLTDALIRFCIRKKTLDMVYIYNLSPYDANWARFVMDLGGYVELVPFEFIYVAC